MHPIPSHSFRHSQTSGLVRPHILLAEDDDEMRALVAVTLREDGYEVTEVRDGGRLLEHLANEYLSTKRPWESFDLIVSDIRMPVCSGLRVVEALREGHWPTPMVLMTAFGDEQTRALATRLGVVLLDKPFDLDELRRTIARLLTAKSLTISPPRVTARRV